MADAPPHEMLRESLLADSPMREASIARLIIATFGTATPFVLLLAFRVGWALPLMVEAVIGALITYYLIVLAAIRRGWFRPWIAWVSVLVEVSFPFFVLVVTTVLRGPEYSAMSSVHVGWGALIVASSLRQRPRLSLAASTLATFEWLVLYAFLFWPKLPHPPPPQLAIGAAILRGVIILLTGSLGYLIARLYVAKAQDVLSAVRERDLMGRYFLHETVGAGGMAEVYRATYCPEGGFQKTVAIKRVLPTYSADPQLTELLREEARLGAMLTHPNIVQVLDCGKYRDRFIIAMEYVDGATLRRIIDAGISLPLPAVTFLAHELARALEYIHQRHDENGEPLHLVHRDVNPPNVLISRIGEVKLTDFGVAQRGDSQGAWGKLRYCAPEQARREPLDARTDLFALGVTLHEALTGRQLYGPDDEHRLRQGVFPEPPPPSRLRRGVPPELDAFVLKLCAVQRAERFENATQALHALGELRGDLAPFPSGQRALSTAVDAARRAQVSDATARPVAGRERSATEPLAATE